MLTTIDRIFNYTESKFRNSGCTEFPTVREVANALGIKQSVVKDEVENDETSNVMLTSYFSCPPALLGDHCVETLI